ncbi:MAG: 2TM domain-containing protein [Saprospiraceae bacterium]|nr:2TM domain-containing protein [Saprospiraceae bacterium]
MANKDPYEDALARVKRKKEFYGNFFSWIFTSLFLLVLNLLTSPGFLWALFPFVGWGIGVAFHGFDVFGYPGVGRDWEEREIEKEMRRSNRRKLPSGKSEGGLELPELQKREDRPYNEEDLV